MRADAARNRQRILAVADRLFAERGIDVTVDDIADETGVGVGTVYRRFANKHELIRTILVRYLAELEVVTAEACRVSDPWRGIVHLLERTCELVAGNRAYNMAMNESDDSAKVFEPFEAQFADVEQLLDRAQSGGVIRPGVVLADLFAIVTMAHAVAAFTSSVDRAIGVVSHIADRWPATHIQFPGRASADTRPDRLERLPRLTAGSYSKSGRSRRAVCSPLRADTPVCQDDCRAHDALLLSSRPCA